MKNIKILILIFLPFFLFSQEDYKSYENYFPSSKCGEIVHYKYYSVSYCDENKISEWAIYSLTNDNFNDIGSVERTNNFRKDNNGKGSSLNNYRGSGFDRGHLVPAKDMSFNSEAINESFFMTNISPQSPSFNRGGWKKLENEIRKRSEIWLKNKDNVIIITGQYGEIGEIGIDKVPVPQFFYKVFFDTTTNRSIAFLLPNSKVEKKLIDYIVPIGFIESLTGVDFFYKLDDDIEYKLENLDTGKTNWNEVAIQNNEIKNEIKQDVGVDLEGWFGDSSKENIIANKRSALVIGNTDYDVDRLDLKNPINDANLIYQTLKSLDFEVDLKLDLNKSDLIKSIIEFKKVQQKSDISIIYFAGHAFQNQNGDSYLIPTDFAIGNDFNERAVLINNVLKAYDTSEKPTLLILDACRELNNNGLVKPSITDPVNIKLAYSTSFGKLASDDQDKNNTTYTNALSLFFKIKGLSIYEIFHNTSKYVLKKTNESQVPAHYFGIKIEDLKFSKTDN